MANIIQLPVRGVGATRDEWQHLDVILGLTADLLPVVSNIKATISVNSSMQALGKTPSQYNGNRHAVGFSQWTQYQATEQDIEKWSKESDYGICIQTRTIRAVDVDVDDPELAQAIHGYIFARFKLPRRYRDNAAKFLLAFHLGGDFTKRKFKTANGIVEFLATGQQFIACGTHTSGARYEWDGGLPNSGFPLLTSNEFESLWAGLVAEFGIEDSATTSTSVKNQKLADVVSSDPVAQYLIDKRLVKRAERDGRLHLDCPWQDEHTSETGDSSTTYWPAHTGGYVNGHFKCLHAHCEHREDHAFLDAIGYVAADVLGEFERIGAETIKDPDQIESELLKDAPRLKFKVEPAHEFTLRAPPRWIVKGVLPQAELAVVYGDSGSGKTFLALDLCAAIARGAPWRGRLTRQGKVVYVCAEGAGGFRSRLKAYAHQHQIALSDLPIGVIAAAPNMMEKADAVEVAKSIVASGGADIVVLDTFAQVMPGANENSGEDVGKALAHCKGIHRATGALVVLIHHSGKDSSKGARGWSGLRAAADCEIEVLRSDNDRAASVTKLKDGEDGAEFAFKLHTVVVGMDEDGEEITSCVLEHGEGGRPQRKSEPKGNNERLALRVLGDMVELSGEGVFAEELVTGMVNQMVLEEGKRDRRREYSLKAINSLVADGKLVNENGGINFA